MGNGHGAWGIANGEWVIKIITNYQFPMPNDGRCFKSAPPTADAPLGETPRPHCLPNALPPQCPIRNAQCPMPHAQLRQFYRGWFGDVW
ncbi:hypothetical protein [Tolypothrix sp. VBCCA 56010]|uniref:hypothetical protein n=1 Tax=Tolypothrix sp. VBCCA 56010 TaxID=3137731 RepID=UPI003D7EE86F